MINLGIQKLSRRVPRASVAFAMAGIWATVGAISGLAQQSAQPVFPSAKEAIQKLFEAAQSNNVDNIANILGGPADLALSGDEVQDEVDRALFVEKYQEMHRLRREDDGSTNLYVGAENWPFPVPLVEKNGAWYFDSDSGLKEVLFRRIGENELTAIATCHEFVAAEKQYRAKPATPDLEASSPVSLVARAANGSDGGDPVRVHGYYFRVVPMTPTNGNRGGTAGKATGRFTFIAYPAEYRSSGVMTFVVTENGVVYEKDLGASTSELASAMTMFHKDATWRAADE